MTVLNPKRPKECCKVQDFADADSNGKFGMKDA